MLGDERLVRARRQLIASALLALLLPSCGTVEFTAQARAQHHRMSVDPVVALPDEPYLGGPNLAQLIEGETLESGLQDAMARHGIDLGAMARREFQLALHRSGLFELTDEVASDAVFHLNIYEYGLTPLPMSSKREPIIAIEGTLTDQQGRLLWRRRQVTNNVQTPLHSYEEFLADPSRIREAFAAAIRLTVHKLVLHLRGP